MNWLIVTGAVSGLLAVFFLARTFRCIRRRHIVRAGASCLSCGISAAVCGAALVLVFSVFSYGRLTEEQLVSRIEFRRISAEEFQARLMIDGEQDRFFVLRGNEWQMDAKIVSWKPPATSL